MRQTVWESNKKYIDTHNDNADELGFTLAMNEFGDLVSCVLMLIVLYNFKCAHAATNGVINQ